MEHSIWRRHLAEEVCEAYAQSPNIAATAVGGSVARGWADKYSDVEVFVFWQDAPTDSERISAVERSGGSIDVFWADPSAYGRWLAAVQGHDGKVGQLWPLEAGEWSEHYIVDGVSVGVSGFLVSTVDDWISDLVGGLPDDDAEILAATITSRAFVHGRHLLENWVSRLTPYPDALASAIIERELRIDERWWSIDQLAERGDRPAFDSVAVAMQRRLIRLLLAINGLYLLDPKPKWTRQVIAKCGRRPDNCFERLELMQISAPIAAASLLQELFEDTLAVLGHRFPDVDVESARSLFRVRRSVHNDAPGSSR